MTTYQKEQIIKRLKSLAWRLGAVIAVFILTGFTEQILPVIELPTEMKMFIGLVVGEITKYLNT